MECYSRSLQGAVLVRSGALALSFDIPVDLYRFVVWARNRVKLQSYPVKGSSALSRSPWLP